MCKIYAVSRIHVVEDDSRQLFWLHSGTLNCILFCFEEEKLKLEKLNIFFA